MIFFHRIVNTTLSVQNVNNARPDSTLIPPNSAQISVNPVSVQVSRIRRPIPAPHFLRAILELLGSRPKNPMLVWIVRTSKWQKSHADSRFFLLCDLRYQG